MYGLIGKMKARPGQRDALIAILLDDLESLPGCLSYVAAKDPGDADSIWITEVWDNRENHTASLALPAVKIAIAQAMPLIFAIESPIETEPVGGLGLAGG